MELCQHDDFFVDAIVVVLTCLLSDVSFMSFTSLLGAVSDDCRPISLRCVVVIVVGWFIIIVVVFVVA